MMSSDNQSWLMTPYPEIFDKIMMMVGLDSLESLHNCRQVCRTWNAMIMRNIWENPSKRNIIKMRINRNWGPEVLPSDEDIPHAKWLGKSKVLALDYTYTKNINCIKHKTKKHNIVKPLDTVQIQANPKSKGSIDTWADNKISWATTHPPHITIGSIKT